MGASIFISYRRHDSLATTGRLYDRLKLRFSAAQIFMDVDAIEPGLDFVEVIEQEVRHCDVLLAIIGPHWLGSPDGDSRHRLDDNDFVCLEVGAALKRNIRVIPVLVDGASMPQADDLPGELKPLVRRNAIDVGHRYFDSDVERLFQVLDRALAPVNHSSQKHALGSAKPTEEKNLGRSTSDSDGIPKAAPKVGEQRDLVSSSKRVVGADRVSSESKMYKKQSPVLLIVASILLILWALGFFAFHVAGGLIHLLLVIAVIVIIVRLIQRRRPF